MVMAINTKKADIIKNRIDQRLKTREQLILKQKLMLKQFRVAASDK